MQMHMVRDEAAFAALAGPWNRLLARAATDVPFLRHEYLQAWWATRGGGEWPGAGLWVAVAAARDGELEAAAPLFAEAGRSDGPCLRLIGSIEVSDYLDLLAPADRAAEAAQALLEAAAASAPDGWQALDLYNLPPESPSLPALREAAQARGWPVEQQDLQICPVIPLEGGWEAYLAGLDKKQRHEIRRKLRRSEEHPDGVTWRLIREGPAVQEATHTLLELMALDPAKATFLTPAMREHFARAVEAAQTGGWLQLAVLEVGGAPAAAYLNFDYRNRIWVYNSGLDPSHAALSPGWVLLAQLVRWAAENGREAFDFLRGGEDYKLRLGGRPRPVQRLTIRRPG